MDSSNVRSSILAYLFFALIALMLVFTLASPAKAATCPSGKYGLTLLQQLTAPADNAAIFASTNITPCGPTDLATAYSTGKKCVLSMDVVGHYNVYEVTCRPSPPHGTCAGGWSASQHLFAAGTGMYASPEACFTYFESIGDCTTGSGGTAASSNGNTAECGLGVGCAGGACGNVDLSSGSMICFVAGYKCNTPSVNGSCSSTAGACNAGTASGDNNASACGTTRTWTCQGSGGGSNASCSKANPACATPVNGSCSSTAGACSAGSVSNDNGATSCGTTRTWQCVGSNGGSTANCSKANAACPTPVNGSCGSANGQDLTAAPSGGDLCNVGAASTVSGTGPWSWTCAGANGGSTASCSATLCGGPPPVDAVCGPAAGQYLASASAVNSTGLCNPGTSPNVSGSGPWNWTCTGENGGANASCSAAAATTVNGTCKSYGSTYASQPASNTSNGCNAGTYAEYSDTGSAWRWQCTGGGAPTGSTATCSASKVVAVNGSCKSYGSTYSSQPASNTSNGCTNGTYADASDTTSEWKWTCSGSGGGSNASCSADKAASNSGMYWAHTPEPYYSYSACYSSGETWQTNGYLGKKKCKASDAIALGYNTFVGDPDDYYIMASVGGVTSKPCTTVGEKGYSHDSGGGTATDRALLLVCKNVTSGWCSPRYRGSMGMAPISAPPATSDMCLVGTPSAVTDNGSSYTWSCTTPNGSDSCYVLKN